MMKVERITYKASYDKVYQEAINSLHDCGFKVKKEDRESGEILAIAGISLRTYGERLEILVLRKSMGVEVVMHSIPRLGQVYDWEKKGKMNIEKFFSSLDRRLKGYEKSNYKIVLPS